MPLRQPTVWTVPVNAHPQAVRWAHVGETRAVEPTEAACFLPVFRWPHVEPKERALPFHLTYPNGFHVPLGDAHHYTALGFPA